MSLHSRVRGCAVVALVSFACAAVAAQTSVALSGQLLDSLSGNPIRGATVFVEELARETTSDGEGRFAFDAVPPGMYHLYVLADGYSSRRTEIVVEATTTPLIVAIDPELRFQEVISVSARARNQFETFQPTSVLSGQDLAKQVQGSLRRHA